MDVKLERVLVLDSVDAVCAEKLRNAGIEVISKGKLSKDELIAEIKKCEGVVVRSATKVTAEIIEASGGTLKVIGRAGTGVDNIDVEAAIRHGVLVMNTPGGNTNSAVEHTCSLICSLSRSIPEACQSMKLGLWDRKKFMGNELKDKVLAIIGLGRIGKEVCSRMKSFGMKVIGYDPLVSKETAGSWGIEYYPLEEIWPLADYITVHTPLIPQTRYLINGNVFEMCKPSVKIVNVARGGIVEEKALLEALNNGSCAGAALDVFEEEPPKNMDLIKHPKVICTPHLGANTYEAQKRVAIEIADQFIAMSEGRHLTGLVNGVALARAGTSVAKPWVGLTLALGVVASKLIAPVRGCSLNMRLFGQIGESFHKLLAHSVLKGFLTSTEANVNLVNASVLAKELGITLKVVVDSECLNGSAQLANTVEVTIEDSTSHFTLSGGCNETGSLLYRINDCHFSSGLSLEKNLLFFCSPNLLQAFGLVAVALQNSSLLALLSSTSEKETWIVARTCSGLQNIPLIKQVQLVAQIQF